MWTAVNGVSMVNITDASSSFAAVATMDAAGLERRHVYNVALLHGVDLVVHIYIQMTCLVHVVTVMPSCRSAHCTSSTFSVRSCLVPLSKHKLDFADTTSHNIHGSPIGMTTAHAPVTGSTHSIELSILRSLSYIPPHHVHLVHHHCCATRIPSSPPTGQSPPMHPSPDRNISPSLGYRAATVTPPPHVHLRAHLFQLIGVGMTTTWRGRRHELGSHWLASRQASPVFFQHTKNWSQCCCLLTLVKAVRWYVDGIMVAAPVSRSVSLACEGAKPHWGRGYGENQPRRISRSSTLPHSDTLRVSRSRGAPAVIT